MNISIALINTSDSPHTTAVHLVSKLLTKFNFK